MKETARLNITRFYSTSPFSSKETPTFSLPTSHGPAGLVATSCVLDAPRCVMDDINASHLQEWQFNQCSRFSQQQGGPPIKSITGTEEERLGSKREDTGQKLLNPLWSGDIERGYVTGDDEVTTARRRRGMTQLRSDCAALSKCARRPSKFLLKRQSPTVLKRCEIPESSSNMVVGQQFHSGEGCGITRKRRGRRKLRKEEDGIWSGGLQKDMVDLSGHCSSLRLLNVLKEEGVEGDNKHDKADFDPNPTDNSVCDHNRSSSGRGCHKIHSRSSYPLDKAKGSELCDLENARQLICWHPKDWFQTAILSLLSAVLMVLRPPTVAPSSFQLFFKFLSQAYCTIIKSLGFLLQHENSRHLLKLQSSIMPINLGKQFTRFRLLPISDSFSILQSKHRVLCNLLQCHLDKLHLSLTTLLGLCSQTVQLFIDTNSLPTASWLHQPPLPNSLPGLIKASKSSPSRSIPSLPSLPKVVATLTLATLAVVSAADGAKSGGFHCKDSAATLACLPDDYSKFDLPIKGVLIPIDIEILIDEVLRINDKDYSITFSCYFNAIWTDRRVKLRPGFGAEQAKLLEGYPNVNTTENGDISVPVNHEMAKDLWLPNIYIYNLKTYKVMDVLSKLSGLWIGADYKIMFSQSTHITFICPMHFDKFPLDTQVCKFLVGSYSYDDTIMKFHTRGASYQKPQGNSIALDYAIKINKLSEEDRLLVFGSLGNFSLAGFELVLSRYVSTYIITYYLPSGLFVIVSWISFLIPMDVIPGRMALLVTLFLVLVNIFNTVTTNTPKAEGLTAIEAWMLACILFVFGALIE